VEKACFPIKFMEVRNMAQPEKRFKAGSCEAAVFENEIVRDGQTISVKKVAIQKRYKDKDNEWKSTHSLDQNDIPKMMLALSKAYEYLTLREDKPNEEVAVEEL
jgi:hypothetical protein